MAPTLSGIIPALTTPFEKGSLSISGLRSNIEKYNRFDLSGYLVLGSTGEGILMDEYERIQAIETVRDAASEGKKVLAGTGMPSTRGTIEMTNRAAEAGADYGLVVSPFFYKGQMTARNLEAYYREVADHVNIPLLMYSVPKFTGFSLPLETVSSLAVHPNIVGLKDSSGNIAFLEEVLKACPQDFALFQGMGSVVFASLLLGAKGAILALSDMAPAETVDIAGLIKAGETEKAREIQMRILPVNQKIVGGYGVPGIKYAMDLLGFFGGDPRGPLQPIDQNVQDAIKRILEEAELL